MPSCAAVSAARSASREPIATTSQRCDRCIAGITLLTAIAAHPSTPHRTRSLIAFLPSSRVQSSSTSVAHRRLRRLGVTGADRPGRRCARNAAARRALSPSPFDGASAASSATLIRALTCDSRLFWAASTTAPWKSRSAARRATGSAHAASTRRSFASISATVRLRCAAPRPAEPPPPRSSRAPRAARAGRPRLAAFDAGEQPADDVGVEEVPRPPRPDAGAGLRAHLDEPLGLEHLDRLAHDRPADPELGGELVLVRQRRPGRPPAADDCRPSSSTTLPVQPTARVAELDHRARPAPLPLPRPDPR